MPLLKDILYKVSLMATSGQMDVEVKNIQFDSRKIQPGDSFIAVKGTQTDGHDYINSAIDLGASSVVLMEFPEKLHDEITYVKVKDSSEALAIMAANYYGNPSEKLELIAVTGTNGKTTIVTILYQLFKKLGHKVGMLSTIENKIDDEVIASTHTTGDAIQINILLQKMIKAGCTHCFMEASSHAIEQNRIKGLKYKGAIFTNISHDHLDYHGTFDAYIKAKKRLFDDLSAPSFSLVNSDDKRGKVMQQNTKSGKFTYGLKGMADFKGKIISNTFQGLELEIDNQSVWFAMTGSFNASNLIACYAAAILIGEESEEVLTQLSSVKSASGRFEQVANQANIIAIVDYAHTPDALKNVLNTIDDIRSRNEKLITVFGCGGNRDRDKRPLMADIACKFSDKVIFTADNPRDEEPEAIIAEMQKGVKPSDFKKTLSITDRREAIKTAVSLAEINDIILVAGKGHETYQEIKGKKIDFDDRKILSELIEQVF